MGKITGFLEFTRELPHKRPPQERVNDYKEFDDRFPEEKLNQQAARCMDCGTPFCHEGCPVGNQIPEFNDAVYRKNYKEAYEILSSTNNFPEFTGRICPAPCESACVLGINQPAITIEFPMIYIFSFFKVVNLANHLINSFETKFCHDLP
jgi:glutamate synthase (NADPH/NADH) small chain